VIKSIWGRGSLAAILVLAVGVALFGCGGGSSTASQAEIAQAAKQGRKEAQERAKEGALERKLERLERENIEAKKRRKKKAHQQQKAREAAHVSPPAESSPTPAPSTAPSGTDCGDGVIAGPETSCGFALNTRAEYEREIGAGSGTVEPYSEANDQYYPMFCTEGAEHECSGAITATVFWP
jgi:hypothetical protein